MISISMFNNKGGVGKTTLTCNIASFFARKYNLRVLVVDCDPQCNATQLIMGESFAEDFYWNENFNNKTTIKNILQPIEDGDSGISDRFLPILSSRNRFRVDLLPGHPGLSIIEDRLGAAWHDLLGGELGGIRKTNWNTALCLSVKDKYDFVFYDLGPSLGSINRSVLIGCECFITPMGADIFSILGVRNIASWIKSWVELYRQSIALCESRTPGRLEQYPITLCPRISNGYVGYTMQQYITKSKEGVRRPTGAFERVVRMVPQVIEETMKSFYFNNLSIQDLSLGDVPHFYSLIPLAQSVAAPLVELQSSDGLVGSQYKQRDEFEKIISLVCDRIAKNIGLEV